MTTEALNFPVFHSHNGVSADNVVFDTAPAANLKKAKDFDLAQAAAEGSMPAFEELYNRHHRRVYAICLRMLQNASEAEDLTQDVFIQLYRKIGSFRGDSAFTTWLHRMTVNQVLMHFRNGSAMTVGRSRGACRIRTRYSARIRGGSTSMCLRASGRNCT